MKQEFLYSYQILKGILASLAEKGEVTEKIAERLAKVHVEDFEPSSYPCCFLGCLWGKRN